MALDDPGKRTWSGAGDRWYAEGPDQCWPDQPEGIFGSYLPYGNAEAADAGRRRRRPARRGWLQHRASPHRAGARIRGVSRRRLDGGEDARCERRQRRRRAAGIRRPDRPAAAARRIRRHLAARGALIATRVAWRCMNHTDLAYSAGTHMDRG